MNKLTHIHLVVFDWGNTLMVDFPDESGPMYTWKKVALIEGVNEILPYLKKRNYTLAIATNAGLSNATDVRKALERVNIASYFSYIFTSKDLGYKKPDPLFFQTILQMVCVEPSHSVMIGDHYEKDIVGAAKVGMHTILLSNEHREFPDANFIVSRLNEITQIL